jgi:flagellar biosynthesis/type III secretory pathway protein FliH
MAGDAYVVAVPQFEVEPERPGHFELDERFAAPHHAAAEGADADPLFADPLFDGVVPDAPAAAAPEPQIDWERVRADARDLIDRAAADGESMLAESNRRARELVDTAMARVAAIEAESRTRGYDDGMRTGREAVEKELTVQVASLEELIESAREQRAKIIESAEPELLRLALSIAERVVHEKIETSPTVVVENVRQALTRLVSREVVTLRINPADLETIRTHRDALAASSDVEHLRIVEDQRVDRGGVVVETDAGTIDAKISTQLREVRRSMQNGDGITLPPSHDHAVLHSQAHAS